MPPSARWLLRRVSLHDAPRKLLVERGPGYTPSSLYGNRRYVQHFCNLIFGQPAEEAQLDNLALSRIELGQFVQGLIQHEQIQLRLAGNRERVCKSYLI